MKAALWALLWLGLGALLPQPERVRLFWWRVGSALRRRRVRRAAKGRKP